MDSSQSDDISDDGLSAIKEEEDEEGEGEGEGERREAEAEDSGILDEELDELEEESQHHFELEPDELIEGDDEEEETTVEGGGGGGGEEEETNVEEEEEEEEEEETNVEEEEEEVKEVEEEEIDEKQQEEEDEEEIVEKQEEEDEDEEEIVEKQEEEEEEEDDDDDEDEETAVERGGGEAAVVVEAAEEEEYDDEEEIPLTDGGEGFNYSPHSSVSGTELIDQIKEEMIDKFEGICENQLEKCTKASDHFGPNPDNNQEIAASQGMDQNGKVTSQNLENQPIDQASELTHLKLQDFLPLFEPSMSSSNGSDNNLSLQLTNSVCLSQSPIAEVDSITEESIYPLIGKLKTSPMQLNSDNHAPLGSINYNPPTSYAINPIINSPPLSPIMERSIKNSIRLSKKDQNSVKRLSINDVSELIKESNHGSISKSQRTESTVKAKIRRNPAPLKRRINGDNVNNFVNQGVNDENRVDNSDGRIGDEVENCNHLMNGGRISTESYSPGLRKSYFWMFKDGIILVSEF